MKQAQIPGIVYLPLTVFLTISLWQTAKGFEDLVGETFAWGFSIGLSMIMGFLTYLIGFRRLNKLPILGFITFYFLCFLFSFTGNFNAVYTNYQTEQLYRDELTKHRQQLQDVLAASTKALDNFAPDTEARAIRVETLTQQLVSQITDSARPGLGKRAREIIKELEAVLGERLTEFAGSPAELAKKYSDNIDSIAQKQFGTGDYGRIHKMKEQNAALVKELDALIEEALLARDMLKDQEDGRKINIKVVNGINKIGTDTQEFIKDLTKFKFDKVRVETQELGKIAFSFKSGFTQHTFVAFILSLVCIFFDWAVVAFLIVRYGRKEVEPYQPSLNKGVDL
ncbi:hypothetical protein EDC44_12224 [Cricetibacter osteomyelitidis]|uniref:Uncharacterized protein n=1 Tax=Cricetibacter osteomyelitidis TaxID=1521931 RepID=A0A4R2SSI8_9PAST|nr:hypothetical protein [Cricetibacter osteomyelitidis]TCP93269.1 hypothetical protein EDC44_12224 [Cricetibacter osteomyelitidis]